MRQATNRRLRNIVFGTTGVAVIGFAVFYFAYPTRWLDERLYRWAKGTRLEDVAYRQLVRRHGSPLARDFLDGRFVAGTPIADVSAAYAQGDVMYFGRFTQRGYPLQDVVVTTVDGRVMRVECNDRPLVSPLSAEDEAERRRELDDRFRMMKQVQLSRIALRGLVGFAAVADPRPSPNPFSPADR